MDLSEIHPLNELFKNAFAYILECIYLSLALNKLAIETSSEDRRMIASYFFRYGELSFFGAYFECHKL